MQDDARGAVAGGAIGPPGRTIGPPGGAIGPQASAPAATAALAAPYKYSCTESTVSTVQTVSKYSKYSDKSIVSILSTASTVITLAPHAGMPVWSLAGIWPVVLRCPCSGFTGLARSPG